MARAAGGEAKADVAVEPVDAKVAAAGVVEARTAKAKAAMPKAAAKASS